LKDVRSIYKNQFYPHVLAVNNLKMKLRKILLTQHGGRYTNIRHRNRCSASRVVGEVQITPQMVAATSGQTTASVGKNLEKLELRQCCKCKLLK
jgi:hypothetical protein